MRRRLASINIKGENTPIKAVDVFVEDDGECWFIADCDINRDGLGENIKGTPEYDPDFQPDTAYHFNGKPIDPYKVSGITLPTELIRKVIPVVLGCKASIYYFETELETPAIVNDIGPSFKLGEATPKAAYNIGMNPSPTKGGEDDYNKVMFRWWPGKQITIDDITYPLQKL